MLITLNHLKSSLQAVKTYINNVLPKKVSDLVDDSGHYTKPSGGIPASDLADGVIPDLTEYAKKDEKADIISKEIYGSIVSFTDGADDLPLKSCVVNIEPIQEGIGDPSPENIRPISGRTGLSVARSGINIWDEEWEIGSYNGTTGEKTTITTNIRCKNAIPVKASTTYYTKSPYAMYVFEYDADDVYLGYTAVLNNSVTTKANSHYIRFHMLASYGTTYNNDISINYPSTDHDYHTYQGEAYSVNWATEAGTVYGGTLDAVSGKLTVDRAITTIADLSWKFVTTYTRFESTTLTSVVKRPATNAFLVDGLDCSCYTARIPSNTGSNPINYSISVSAAGAIYIRDESFSTVDDFLSGVGDQTISYPLASPIEYQLTPQEIRTLLGENNIWSDGDNITIEYSADTKKYIDQIEPDLTDYVKNTDYATTTDAGVVKVNSNYGIYVKSDHSLGINAASDSQIKAGTDDSRPIVPINEHTTTFYGLAKAAGDTTQSSSNNAVGNYTDSAKTAIKNMLGVPEDPLAAGAALPASADLNSYTTPGNYTADSTVIASITHAPTTTEPYKLVVESIGENLIRQTAISANHVYQRTGDMSSSSWVFGDWVKEIKSTDYATTAKAGIVRVGNGLTMTNDSIGVNNANSGHIKSGVAAFAPIAPLRQHESVFYGLAKASGDTTQSASDNAVGTYTDAAKSAIQNMLGISDGYVTKDSIDNAGITDRTYTTVYGGEFTVTTATTDGYTHPTATIECEPRPTFYSYRVSFTNNSTGETTEYIIPGRTWVENNRSLFSYLGNLQYFTAEIDMVPGGTDTQCPFLIKERYSNSKYYLDISTETAGSYTFLVEKIAKTKTTISPELIYGIETSPIKILRSSEAAKVFGLSIGAENFLYSHSNNVAIGNANVVSSSNSTAIGHFNQVQATGAIAEGYGAIANAPYSHATGYATLASGQYAHSEGYRTTASGNFSHAEGSQTTASGRFSHSAGGSTVANGYASCANGYFTKANSFGMYAIGENNVEDTIYEDWVSGTSYTIGDCVSYNGIGFKCTVANSDTTFNEEHWQFLKSNGSTAFVIGNGGVLTTDTPSNAYKVDWDGNGYYNGDVYVNCAADSTGGTKLISETDYATGQKAGLVRVYGNGVQMIGDRIAVTPPSDAQIKAGTAIYTPLGPAHQHKSVFYGLAKAAGDTTQSSSNNAVGTYTTEAKSAIRSMLGIENTTAITVEVQGTSPTITAESNVRYTCGEVTSITITPPQIGICDVIFTSGSTPAILTLPNTVKMPDYVDLTILEANTIYEINIVDGIYGTVMTWKI